MSENGQDADLLADLRRAVDEINAQYAELDGESARAAAILAVASLEEELEHLVASKFPGISGKLWKEMAGPGFTPIGSFKTKNMIAHAFGFYGPKTRSTLEVMAAIRNKFAHDATVRQFDNPLVVQNFKKLADNPFAPFRWSDDMSAARIREIFLDIAMRLEKELLEVRSLFLFPPERPPDPLP